MRSYAKFPPTFWTSDVGKRIKALGAEAQVLAVYLLTSPHANMLGVYYLALPSVCHETGLPPDVVPDLFRQLEKAEFCTYDHPSEVVWVHDLARNELGEALKPNDHQVRGVQRTYDNLPNCPFLRAFFDRYGAALHLQTPRGLEGASKGLGRGDGPVPDPAPVPDPVPAREEGKGLGRGVTVGEGGSVVRPGVRP